MNVKGLVELLREASDTVHRASERGTYVRGPMVDELVGYATALDAGDLLSKVSSAEYEKRINDVYAQRNELAVALATLASALGWEAGVRADKTVPEDWSRVVHVQLPGTTTQVSWHLSPDTRHLADNLPAFPHEWDGTYIGREKGWTKTIDLQSFAKPGKYSYAEMFKFLADETAFADVDEVPGPSRWRLFWPHLGEAQSECFDTPEQAVERAMDMAKLPQIERG